MNELVIRNTTDGMRCGPFTLTKCGMGVSGAPTFEEWRQCGSFLQRSAGAVQWWVGDWLNYGEKAYGETYTAAIEATGLHLSVLENAKWVAKAFESSRRLETLSFSHHAEVAALPPHEANELLTRAEAEGLSTRAVRQLARQLKNGAAIGVETDDCCTVENLATLASNGMTFGTIYADPPWSYDNQGTRASTDNHYGTMTIDDLTKLPVVELAAPQSHLWLWTTNAFLFECPKIFAAWGFEFKSSYVWAKPTIGIGNYLRNSHEFLLLAVRGGLTAAARNVRSWDEFPRTEHSAKPEKIRTAVVEKISPGPRLELFGRRVAPGWVVWGNQVSRTMFDTAVKEIV